VHAVGGGVLLAEVQQTSDATFRLFDWNRRDSQGKARPLHIREALACIDWSRGPVEPISVPGFTDASGHGARQPLVRCEYFELEYVQDRKPITVGGDGRMHALIVLRGGGRWRWPETTEDVTPGQVWLLPAAMPSGLLEPQPILGALYCTLP
jgi:mannose-6-phosphate isomerase